MALDRRSEYGPLNGPEVRMSIETDVRPITYLESRAADLLKQINETRRHVVITQNGEPKAVLQDPTSFVEQTMRRKFKVLWAGPAHLDIIEIAEFIV